MTLSARVIALQGIGSAPIFIALQGLVPVSVPAPIPPQLIFGGGGGGGSTSRRPSRKRARAEDDALLLFGTPVLQ